MKDGCRSLIGRIIGKIIKFERSANKKIINGCYKYDNKYPNNNNQDRRKVPSDWEEQT
jgi:hypothetical protein